MEVAVLVPEPALLQNGHDLGAPDVRRPVRGIGLGYLLEQFLDRGDHFREVDAVLLEHDSGFLAQNVPLLHALVPLFVRICELVAWLVHFHGKHPNAVPPRSDHLDEHPRPRKDVFGQEDEDVVAVLHPVDELLEVVQVFGIQKDRRVEELGGSAGLLLEDVLDFGSNQRGLCARFHLEVRKEHEVLPSEDVRLSVGVLAVAQSHAQHCHPGAQLRVVADELLERIGRQRRDVRRRLDAMALEHRQELGKAMRMQHLVELFAGAVAGGAVVAERSLARPPREAVLSADGLARRRPPNDGLDLLREHGRCRSSAAGVLLSGFRHWARMREVVAQVTTAATQAVGGLFVDQCLVPLLEPQLVDQIRERRRRHRHQRRHRPRDHSPCAPHIRRQQRPLSDPHARREVRNALLHGQPPLQDVVCGDRQASGLAKHTFGGHDFLSNQHGELQEELRVPSPDLHQKVEREELARP
mmetsp:Transcript_107302/g.308720  ORF Transcript_107302/g.308720 Transcript_107302/m.308720 type:complete len:469 (-) Transcript_107302:2400-3806(-)